MAFRTPPPIESLAVAAVSTLILWACGSNSAKPLQSTVTSDSATAPASDADSGSMDAPSSDTAVTDSAVATETATVEPSCADDSDTVYPEGASGEACSSTVPCPESGLCSSALFPAERGYTKTRCYPSCRAEDPSAPCCEAGDLCVALDAAGVAQACLARGHARKDELSLKVLPAGVTPTHADVALVAVDVAVGGKKIPLNMGYAIEDATSDLDGDNEPDEAVIVELEGLAGLTGTWVFQITVPKKSWREGELEAHIGSSAKGFDAALTLWIGNQMTVEAVLHQGTFRITAPGETCTARPCASAEISFDLELAKITATLAP